ncbi:MAG: efflux RND transporter permease subunit [Planctomycetes bacterium]|nr:efflux RND transporter permease subunit [Planctomycetota bacterium]
MILTDIAVKNRTTVAVLGLIIVLLGVYSYSTLPREAFPDIPIPYILVNTIYEGVSPADIETSVTMKIEKELNGIRGVKEVTSSSSEGMSMIVVEFTPDVSTDVALQHVRDRVDRVRGELPTDAKEPMITEINLAEFPIMQVSITGDVSPVQLKEIADDMQDAMETLPGVLKVDVLGALEPEIRMEFDRDRMALYNLVISDIMQLIPTENVNISAGGLETQGTKFNVRIPAEFVSAEEVDHLLLTVRDGKPIYLADVATVRDAFKDRTTYSRLNGRDNVTLSIQKRAGANVVKVADSLKAVVAEAQKRIPGGVSFDVVFDMSKYIRAQVADLENNMASGLILVVGVLLLFLGWRSSLIVSLIIPFSMLGGFFLLQALGYTLNMIVLYSLILALGMLVDSAIVIVENIYRHIELGKSRTQAALVGTSEVAWPVITSTLTNVASFIPLIFWPGIMGDFMKYLPITVTIVLMTSLFVALVFNPTFCASLATAPPKAGQEHWFIRGYRRVQRVAISAPLTTVTLAFLLLAGSIVLYAKRGNGVEFFPQGDPERATIDVRLPQGTNIRETDRIVRLIEHRIKPYEPWIEHTVTNVGSSGGMMSLGATSTGPHLANITLVFYDYEIRERPSTEIIAALRNDVADIPGAEIKVEREKDGPPTGAPVTVRIIGENFKVLEGLSRQAQDLIVGVPGLVNLRSDLEATRPELTFTVDRRRAVLLGVNTATIGNFLKMAIFGTKVGTYRQFNDEYDITVRLPLVDRVKIDDLNRIQIPNVAGQAVPLSSLGRFDYQGGFGTINRVSQKRVVTLTADAEGRLSTAVLADAQKQLKKLALPSGYEIRYTGEKEEQDKAQAFLLKAFVLCILLIVMILVMQFNSLLVPLIIMSTVLLSLVGILLGLVICHLPFNIIMTGIAVISLAGIVVNNGIVLLDFARQLQDQGLGLVEAMVEAGVTRLRPVLLSAATNFIGLVPMAIGISYDFHTFTWATKSESTQWWQNMSIAIIFGLSITTVLTLVVVPSLYVMLTRASLRVRRAFFGVAPDSGAAAPAPAGNAS